MHAPTSASSIALVCMTMIIAIAEYIAEMHGLWVSLVPRDTLIAIERGGRV